MRLSEEEGEYIYCVKALAVFSVVCAHCSPVADEAEKITLIISELLNYLGTMGVPVFFILSGYLFYRNKKTFAVFWKGKIRSLFIPWLFCETVLWMYVVLRKGEVSLGSWLLFMIGYQHTTYYLTVLVLMYLIFWVLRSDKALYGTVVLSIFSMVCTGWEFGINFVNSLFGTYYLNPLNWMAFFAIGMLLSKKDLLLRGAEKLMHVLPLNVGVSALCFILAMRAGWAVYYFSRYALAANMANIAVILALGFIIARQGKSRIKDYAEDIGRMSFSIYLLHQFFAGVVVRVTNRMDNFIPVLLRPFIIIVATVICIRAITGLAGRKFPFMNILIGMRT